MSSGNPAQHRSILRRLARLVARAYLESRRALGFPWIRDEAERRRHLPEDRPTSDTRLDEAEEARMVGGQ